MTKFAKNWMLLSVENDIKVQFAMILAFFGGQNI